MRITNHMLEMKCNQINSNKENYNITSTDILFVDGYNNVSVRHQDTSESILFYSETKREAFIFLAGMIEGAKR